MHPKRVVYRFLKILNATQITLGCQHRGMAEEELDLLQFASSV